MKVKFLIIRFSSIGDIVLTTPVIRGLKQQVDDAEVHYLTKETYSGMLENNPWLDKVHTLKPSLKETLRPLQEEGFDYVIDLHHNLRTWRIKNRLKVLDFSVNKLNKEKWMMVNLKKNRLPDLHIVDRYMECVKLFDVENDEKGLEYFIPEETNVSQDVDGKYIAFAIGGQHDTKKLPNESIRKICENLNYPVVLLGGHEDKDAGNEIAQGLDHVYNYCGALNLNESSSFVRDSHAVITHDTGLMHIAAAFSKPVISIWGNTIPEFGMTPYLPESGSRIFEVKNLSCRPCSKIGHNRCPKKHFDCMKKQDIQAICEHANLLLLEN